MDQQPEGQECVLMQQYSFEVAHIPGTANGNADSLSRTCTSTNKFVEGEGGRSVNSHYATIYARYIIVRRRLCGTTGFKRPRALWLWRSERSEDATYRARGLLNPIVPRTFAV